MTAIADHSSIGGPWDGWLATLAIVAVYVAGRALWRAYQRATHGHVTRDERRRQHDALIAAAERARHINHYAHASACARQAARKQEDAS